MPVSAFTGDFLIDGSIRNNVSFAEKRTIAVQVPTWDADKCIQCSFCAYVCPHATIRPFLLTDEEIANAPMEFKTAAVKPGAKKDVSNLKYRIQVSPANCVGCGLCAVECPTKALTMVDINAKLDQEPLAEYLFKHTEYKTDYFDPNTVKGSQFLMPYFEVSGSCPGCGETPYYKLVSQLFGKDMLVANATGCSMIYCSSTPSTPFVNDANGEGVAWANSLFEDNAEFGYGMALAQSYKEGVLLKIMEDNMDAVEPELKDAFAKYIEVHGDREAERAIAPTIKELVAASANEAVKELADMDLISKSMWIVGGDGWAYDIGYGGLDHVIANNLNVNILVLDTEVYSNTGGQSSKSSQAASIAKFAAGGKTTAKKDLAQIAMAYGHVYVASIAMGANRQQTLNAIKEAESYNGPSLILAYSPCAEHGIKGGLANHQQTQKNAVACGYVDLFRYDPRKETPLTIDSKAPNYDDMLKFMMNETRYAQLTKLKGQETAYEMFEKTKADAMKRRRRLEIIAKEGF